MIRVKVSLPEIDTPFFDGKVTEENYDKFKDFLDELTKEYGEGNLEYSAIVVPEKGNKDKDCCCKKESELKEDSLAEYLKDHPIVEKTIPEDASKVVKDIDNNLKEIISDDGDDESSNKITDDELPYIEVKVNYTLQFLSEIFTVKNSEFKVKKENVVDGTFDTIDSICRSTIVKIPCKVLDTCTNTNIAKFIIQSVIFQLLDAEYYDIEDEHLTECFTDDFDDSYCYDTGVLDITFNNVENVNIWTRYLDTISRVMEEVIGVTLDYREMEKLYIKLRQV